MQTDKLFTLKQIGPGVWAAIEPGGQSNAGVIVGEDGVTVIDTFITADTSGNLGTQAAAEQLLTEIRTLTNLPVKFVVNTHYHLDHVGGNGVFVNAGAVVLAQTNVRRWIHTENLNLFGANIKPAQKAFIEALPAPSVASDEGLDLYSGSRRIEVRTFQGHTGSDSVVIVPDAKVIFTGDLFWRHTLPNLMDATTKVWVETLDALVKTFPEYTFIPGHGDVGNLADIVAFREYLRTVRTLTAMAQDEGQTGDALVKAVSSTLADQYSNWDFFQLLVERNIRDVDAEFKGGVVLSQRELRTR